MATVNVRLDDKLKNEAYAVLERLNVSPTEAVRQLFQYIAENEKLPLKTITISTAEDELIKTVRKRLADPQAGIKVSLDEL
ncbi:type II toxin-antitoxin system RelB/DinJ family antitoxin [Erwinia tasmaniensis]|uniref:type II toxin-antitoxin system RelB/DinJ family antitoxin n=1 Tax=Erwinia tasmaniensis TaxID=338565 RepID=UPI003A4DE2C5